MQDHLLICDHLVVSDKNINGRHEFTPPSVSLHSSSFLKANNFVFNFWNVSLSTAEALQMMYYFLKLRFFKMRHVCSVQFPLLFTG